MKRSKTKQQNLKRDKKVKNNDETNIDIPSIDYHIK